MRSTEKLKSLKMMLPRWPFRRFPAVMGILFTAGVLILSACNYAAIDDEVTLSTTPEKVSAYQLFLQNEYHPYEYRLKYHPFQTWLSLSYAPAEVSEDAGLAVGLDADDLRVKPFRTPWAPAYDREQVILTMNRILIENGIESESMRVRMIAHAIVASGWKQKVWNFNAWGVRQGSWDKSWYVMPTYEEDDDGDMIYVSDASWRAFSGWDEAIRDFQQRISPDSERPSYREAYKYLSSTLVSFRVARAYWEALSDGNYYTATWFTGEKFARLCGGVREVLKSQETVL
ncbi:MAG: hypothetical protein JXX14_03405 [Deltaproteobacteria bacterium]|nr:hypothetical protein [Deltaproteobacteria bacterium]